MKITDLKTVKKSRVKEAINPALSFEHDDSEFAAKKRGPGYFDYSMLKREDFNDDDWYVWDPDQQQFVASYGARSSTALDFRMRESFSGTYKMPDGKIAMRGMKAKFMPGIESRGDSNLEEAAKTLQMIEGWEEFKETAPALKEIRRRRTNEAMSRRAFLGSLGSVAAGAALGHAYTKDQQQQSYRENVQQAELFTDRAEQALTAGDIKSACRYFSRAADAYDAAGLEKFAEPLRQLSLDCMKKSGMSQGKGMMEGEDGDKCPPATQNIKLNLKNRQKAIDEYGYGPLNPDMPNTKFWMKKVDEWNLDSADEAKQSLCGNCAAFDQRQHTLDCIAQGIDSDSPNDAAGVINAGELGYCKFLKFKCASRRTCDAWVTGGPLTDQSDSTQVTENLRDWFKEKWVRFGPDGKIRGDCARGSESEGKPKCLPQAKAHALGKKGRASAAARKRREDPNANRTGAAINVATKKKTNEVQLDEKCWDTHRQVGMKKKGGRMVPNCVPKESIEESHKCPECGGPSFTDLILAEKKDACYYKVKASAKVWPSAYASGRLVQCRKKGAANYGNKSESKQTEDQLEEKWTQKYKSSINCSNPKGFSQRAHCAGRKKNESVDEAANAAQQAAIAINMKKRHKKPKGVAEGKDDLSQYSTERLQAYVKKVSGGGVPAFGSGAKLKRVQAELKRRERGVAEGLETNKYQVVVKGQKRSYSVWVEAKNEEVAIIRAQQYVAREHNDHGTRAAVVDMKKGVAEGKDDLSQYSTERLQAYVKKVSGGGVPAFGSGAKLKRVQAELKRRERGVAEGTLNEGVMDQLKRIYMMLVSDLPMGTPESEFLGHWQRIIKNELGKNIKIDTLAKLRNNFVNRYKSMGHRGDAMDWHREMGQDLEEGADDIAQAKERLAYLEKIFDTSYEYSDDHSVWKKHNAIRQEMDQLKKIIRQGGIAEAEDNKDTAAAKKPGFIDDVKQGAEDYKDLWMMGATGRTPERWKTSAEKAAERGSAPGPQFPLKEGRMKEIAIEFQDYKHLPDMAFQSRYKISKRDWWNKYAKLVQGAGLGIGMDEARDKVKAKVVHPRPTRAEREHDRIRKERGLPNPSHYKTLGDKLAKEIAALRGDDVTEANIDADELVSVYVKGQHKGRSLKIPVAKNFPNKHIDLLTRRLEARGINPSAIHYGPTTRKVAEDDAE